MSCYFNIAAYDWLRDWFLVTLMQRLKFTTVGKCNRHSLFRWNNANKKRELMIFAFIIEPHVKRFFGFYLHSRKSSPWFWLFNQNYFFIRIHASIYRLILKNLAICWDIFYKVCLLHISKRFDFWFEKEILCMSIDTDA